MTETLTEDEINARIVAAQTPEPDMAHMYVRAMPDVATDLIQITTDHSERFMFGLTEIDTKTRGIGDGELCMVIGLPHSGKTQLVLNGIANNPDKRGIIFTPDEVAELVLSKLVSIIMQTSAEVIEAELKDGVDAMHQAVREIAANQLRNLMVVDSSLSFAKMTDAINEAEQTWQAPTDYVMMDYLELFGHDSDAVGVTRVAQETKHWGKEQRLPIMCLHQSGMSKAPRGQAGGMDAMRYGGTAEAIYVLEVYRRSQDTTLDPAEQAKWANTITVNVAKNKRPPSRTGIDDMYIDPECGYIRHLRANDLSARPFEPPPDDADPTSWADHMLEEL